MARDDALDVLDLDALGLLRADQVADFALGQIHGHGLARELAVREQAVERAFEIAAVVSDRLRDIGEHRLGNVKARMGPPRKRDARVENLQAQVLGQRSHFDDKAAGEARPHALVETLQVKRRGVGGGRDRPRLSRLSRPSGGRSAAITTWRPPSISEFSVWENSACVCLPWRNCRSSMTRTSMPRSASLTAIAVWLRSAETKLNMNRSAVR